MSATDPDQERRELLSVAHHDVSDVPRWLLPLELGYVLALVAVLLLYHHNDTAQRVIPDPAGPIPIGVVWWGALGGVTNSLTGILSYRQRIQANSKLATALRFSTLWHSCSVIGNRYSRDALRKAVDVLIAPGRNTK
jgi:hypothetical protein